MSETTEKLDSENAMEQYFFRASAEDFMKIPGSPLAYWAPKSVTNSFVKFPSLKKFAVPSQGMATTNNGQFLRLWYECSSSNFVHPYDVNDETRSSGKWFACNKGGPYRKWYGNNFYVVNYENSGQTICDYIDNTPGVRVKSNGRVINRDKYFKVGTTWSTISSSSFSMRYTPEGFVFETKGAMCFPGDRTSSRFLTALGCSKVVNYLLEFISPTLDYHEGPLGKLPIAEVDKTVVDSYASKLIDYAVIDWDSSELSWDFSRLSLFDCGFRRKTLRETYEELRRQCQEKTREMQFLEEENNRTFIEAYGLQDELTPEVSLKNITLICNPQYRYNGDKSEDELEALLLADTMREFISYAVGCMFGRYSLDKEGLILANQGETLEDYTRQVPDPQFMPDDDNVIPLVDFDGDWFEDDISERFKQFLKITFGEEHYSENLAFIEEAIGKDIKKFFLKDFYTDHIKRYKKRPIYWLFSSPKGSFNALIYMHRYRPDTASIVLNDYLREFRTKLTARKQSFEQVGISASASQKEKTQAIKAIEKINKVLDEISEYEHDILYPLATRKIEIDLDDGVKHNYPLFGNALKKVTGLSK